MSGVLGRFLARMIPVGPPDLSGFDLLDGADTVSVVLVDTSSPNVMAFTWTRDCTEWTLFRSTPGDTTPHIQFRVGGGDRAVDCGEVVMPERFGPLGTTKADFKEWCSRFIKAQS